MTERSKRSANKSTLTLAQIKQSLHDRSRRTHVDKQIAKHGGFNVSKQTLKEWIKATADEKIELMETLSHHLPQDDPE